MEVKGSFSPILQSNQLVVSVSYWVFIPSLSISEDCDYTTTHHPSPPVFSRAIQIPQKALGALLLLPDRPWFLMIPLKSGWLFIWIIFVFLVISSKREALTKGSIHLHCKLGDLLWLWSFILYLPGFEYFIFLFGLWL